MTQMIELEKNMKAVIISILSMFRKLGGWLNMLNKEMKDIKKIPKSNFRDGNFK